MKYAFKPTIPILTGFLFLGMTYGIYMHTLGHPWWMAVMMSALIFVGSLEFIAGVMLLITIAVGTVCYILFCVIW